MTPEDDDEDKCKDCPFNDTGCPGGMWCTEDVIIMTQGDLAEYRTFKWEERK